MKLKVKMTGELVEAESCGGREGTICILCVDAENEPFMKTFHSIVEIIDYFEDVKEEK